MRFGRFLLAVFLITGLLAGCGKQAPAAAPAAVVAAASSAASGTAAAMSPASRLELPADILEFRAKRDLCDHFRGEEPYDSKRAAFLTAELARNCTGTDQALADLRRRHANDPKAIAALKDYESRIE
jgi:hypothetical protein